MPTCKKCNAPIVWIRTPAGKPMPCNADLVEYHAGDWPDYEDIIPHWATCPFSDSFRGRGQYEL